MKIRSICVAAVLGAASLLSSNASASLVVSNWKATGDGLVTRDSSTGLEWLDLSATDGASYATVLTRLSTDFVGWRVASAFEAETLFLSLGLPLEDSFGPNPTAAAAVRTAVELFGNTFSDYFSNAADGRATGLYGFVDLSGETGFHVIKGAFIDELGVFSSPTYDGEPGDVRLYTANRDGMANDTVQYKHIGTFLVRDASAVPEPATSLLVLVALIALVVLKSHRRTAPCREPHAPNFKSYF